MESVPWQEQHVEDVMDKGTNKENVRQREVRWKQKRSRSPGIGYASIGDHDVSLLDESILYT